MDINKLIDHTYLKAFGTRSEIDKLISEAKEYHFKSVCINPCHVRYAKSQLKDSDVLVCSVIGFPLGANTLETKVFETLDAIKNGADEIDMVINIGEAKAGNYAYIKNEVDEVVRAAKGHTVKCIIETCYLSEQEIIKVSETINQTNAEFVKTSTGFGPEGATKENVRLMKQYAPAKKIKAAGGVRSRDDLMEMVEAGASRIGTSNGVSLMKDQSGSGY